MFDLSKMKKKKKKKKAVEEETAKTDSKYANYTYDELLDRVAKIIQEKNPELGEKRRHTMKPPQRMRIGTKKTCLLYTSPSPRDLSTSRMPSSA